VDRVHDRGDLLAAEHPEDLIDAGHLFQQHLALPLGHAPGDDDGAELPGRLQGQHLADDPERLLPGRLDEAAGVDHDHVRPGGVGPEGVPVLGQLAEHSFGIDGVLRAPEGHEGEGLLGGIGGGAGAGWRSPAAGSWSSG
jgi:hypothetical protein